MFNRRKFLEISKLLNKIATQEGKIQYDKSKLNNLFSIVQIDLNFFKQLNDTYGHKIGDRILTQTARFFAEYFRRENDIIIRTGGDEFVIVIFNDDQTNSNFTQSVTDYLSEVSQNSPKFPFSIPDMGLESTYQLSFAYGIATFDSDHDTNFEDTLHRADIAMYKHKTEMKSVPERRKSMQPRARITEASKAITLGTKT